MKDKEIIIMVQRLEGNLTKFKGNIYISSENIMKLPEFIQADEELSFLITPYLILDDSFVYELHYYEFELSIEGNNSYFIEYSPKNCLPKEIINNLNPRAIIAKGDINFFKLALKSYLESMKKMKFPEIHKFKPSFKKSRLYYQIF